MYLHNTPQTQLSFRLIVRTLSALIYPSNSPAVFGRRAILLWRGIEAWLGVFFKNKRYPILASTPGSSSVTFPSQPTLSRPPLPDGFRLRLPSSRSPLPDDIRRHHLSSLSSVNFTPLPPDGILLQHDFLTSRFHSEVPTF